MDNFPSIQTILDEFIQHILEQNPISASDLPNIDLYMDQVTTFMDDHLEHSKRYPEDKILTKTMINNYAKNHLLPPPEKKKYSKDHMLLLIFIYYFKNILSINDIQKLLTPINNRYFKNAEGHDMTWLYSHIMDEEPERPNASARTSDSCRRPHRKFSRMVRRMNRNIFNYCLLFLCFPTMSTSKSN